jgi:segregation and condensation protein B
MKRPPPVSRERLPTVIEGVLFVAEGPVTVPMLARAVRRPRPEVESALAELEERCAERGVQLLRADGAVQLVSAPEAGPYIERFLGFEGRQRLSLAALECLAVIAYRQPLTRAEVESVRGVNCDRPIASLIARGLVEDVSRAPGPGRPARLGTTLKFLEHFGLRSPSELPPLPAT